VGRRKKQKTGKNLVKKGHGRGGAASGTVSEQETRASEGKRDLDEATTSIRRKKGRVKHGPIIRGFRSRVTDVKGKGGNKVEGRKKLTKEIGEDMEIRARGSQQSKIFTS